MTIRTKLLASISAAAILIGASVGHAQGMNDAIIANLKDLGYEYIEIKNGPNQTKVEAIKGNTKLEVIYDNATGAIVKQESGNAGSAAGKSGLEVKSGSDDFANSGDDHSGGDDSSGDDSSDDHSSDDDGSDDDGKDDHSGGDHSGGDHSGGDHSGGDHSSGDHSSDNHSSDDHSSDDDENDDSDSDD